LSFRLVRNLFEEGLPTSGNDNNKTTKRLNPEAELRGILLIKNLINPVNPVKIFL
jgi:hypothetical protein